jgi:hypothetical protein
VGGSGGEGGASTGEVGGGGGGVERVVGWCVEGWGVGGGVARVLDRGGDVGREVDDDLAVDGEVVV